MTPLCVIVIRYNGGFFENLLMKFLHFFMCSVAYYLSSDLLMPFKRLLMKFRPFLMCLVAY